jgi:hypothetical protein
MKYHYVLDCSVAGEEHKLKLQRKKAVHKLLAIREELPKLTNKELAALRRESRQNLK